MINTLWKSFGISITWYPDDLMSTIQIFGGVLIKDSKFEHPFYDNDILNINSKHRLIYGIDWIYNDGKEFKDSVFVITWNNDKNHNTISGRHGLPDALKFVEELKRKGF